MKRQWDIEELIEQFTLVEEDEALLANKTGATRLGFALLLKCFQLEGKFPSAKHEIPRDVVNYMAHQLKLEGSLFSQYDWEGRTIKLHRTQIREQYEFREATVIDTEEMTTWLISTELAADQNMEHLKAKVAERFRILRVERLIQTACTTYEQQFFVTVLSRLPEATCEQLDALLERNAETEEEAEREEEELSREPEGRPQVVRWRDLKASPGAIGLETVLGETDKLRVLSSLTFPPDLFQAISPKVVKLYRERVATESITELRRHPDAIRYTYLAAFCLQRKAEIIDSLIDVLLLVIHRIETTASKRIGKKVVEEAKHRVENKPRLLRQVAQAALDYPTKTIRKGIYPVMSREKCVALVNEELEADFNDRVYVRMRSSYRDHYRRMMPGILNMLEFRSNNENHRPVIEALTLLKRYIGVPGTYYPPEEDPLIKGVVRPMWDDLVREKDPHGEWQINRISYELCVLEALRETLRCRELWVVGADKYRNPDDDLPKDFEEKRQEYYEALGQPQTAELFIEILQQQMITSLHSFDQALPKLEDKVRISAKKGGWIHLTPLVPQAEPHYLRKLKAEIEKHWGMTSLLDILKEADLRLRFTRHLHSPATRSVLDWETIQKRLLLCLYGLGTNYVEYDFCLSCEH